MALGTSQRRLDRGKEHIVDLEREFQAFLDSKPYARVVEAHSNGTDQLHKIKFTRPLPGSLADVAADAADNLRSALDQAAYAIAHATGKANPQAFFPFAGSAAEFENALKGRCKDLPQDILTLFRTFQPYRGGNDLLWALNRICVTNKHRLLVPIGISVHGMFIKKMEIHSTRDGTFALSGPVWDRDNNEIVFARTGPGGHIEYDMQISFFVAFDKIEVAGGKPAVAFLNAMAGEVEHILLATEVEARRLGIVP
jgi:hypothetical protein